MIKRIVKMTFEPARVEDFLLLFDEVKDKIRNFEGCTKLELLRDVKHPNVFFTYSIWDSEHHLDMYRFSPLFKSTWEKTKEMFAEKAEAWSLEEVRS